MPAPHTHGPAMLDRLAVALAYPAVADQRAALRTLAHEVVAQVCTDAEVARAFRLSPLVGSAKGQVNPRPGTAGLRDMLKLESLICVVDAWARSPSVCRDELAQTFEAIREPALHGVRGRGRTGFVFGRTRHQTDERVEDIRARVSERLAGMAPDKRAAAGEKPRRSRRHAARPASPPRSPRPSRPPRSTSRRSHRRRCSEPLTGRPCGPASRLMS